MPQNLKAPNFYDDITEALHDLVKFAPGGNSARRIAALTSLPYSTLMNGLSCAESNAGCRLGIESLEPIISAAGGEQFVAGYFAVKAKGVFVELPHPRDVEDARQAAMGAMIELGALCRSFEHALDKHGPGGDSVTGKEFELFEAQANKLLVAAKTMVVACGVILEQSRR